MNMSSGSGVVRADACSSASARRRARARHRWHRCAGAGSGLLPGSRRRRHHGGSAGRAGAPAAGRQGGAPGILGPNANPFAGQTPINAMIVTGGCCHDYTGQSKVLMDTLNAVMPINWTVVQGMSQPAGRQAAALREPGLGARASTSSSTTSAGRTATCPRAIVQNITRPNVARMFFHCTLHSYRVMTNDGWRELIGMTSRRHTRAHNILLKWAEGDPITAGLPPFVTPIDELYVIEKVWPNTKALATAVSPEDGTTYPLVWTHEYQGRARLRHVAGAWQRDLQHQPVQGTADAGLSLGLEEGADRAAAARRRARWPRPRRAG